MARHSMTKERQEKIFKAFPKLFREAKLSDRQSCMGRGITCDDGWFQLIWNLSKKLESHIQNGAPRARAVQVKEKFGMLRMYLRHETKEMSGLVETASLKSVHICERCGKPGKLWKDAFPGYWHTACTRCAKTWYK